MGTVRLSWMHPASYEDILLLPYPLVVSYMQDGNIDTC